MRPFLLGLFWLSGTLLSAQDRLLFVIRVDDITSRTTASQYMPRGILPFQEMAESKGAVVSWAVMPNRLIEPAVNTGGELGRQLRATASRGHELVLHGLDHVCDLDGSSGHEFYHPSHTRAFSYAEQSATIRTGIRLLEDSVGVRPVSFVPPGHYSDATTHQVLTDEGFRGIGINSSPGYLTSSLFNVGTSEDFAWGLTAASYAPQRTATLRDIRLKAASQGHYTFLLHDPFTRPGYLNGLVIRWAGEILDSVKAEYGSRLRFTTIAGLTQALTQTSASVTDRGPDLPATIRLDANAPNPFNPTTTIRWHLIDESEIRLTVHDLLGRTVAVLAAGRFPAGDHSAVFDATGLPSGIYLYRLSDGRSDASRTMMLLK